MDKEGGLGWQKGVEVYAADVARILRQEVNILSNSLMEIATHNIFYGMALLFLTTLYNRSANLLCVRLRVIHFLMLITSLILMYTKKIKLPLTIFYLFFIIHQTLITKL